jgi:hypothetical protein
VDSLRILPKDSLPALVACCRCAQLDRPWDRIADKAYCPNCQELIAVGEAPPLIERTEKKRCAACDVLGTVTFRTFPLGKASAIEIDLCPEHLRGLLARRLGPHACHQLRRQLQALDLRVEDVFLLHGAFYDDNGRALQPAIEAA